MKVIKKTEPRIVCRFRCDWCENELECRPNELEESKDGMVATYLCPRCGRKRSVRLSDVRKIVTDELIINMW